MFFFFFAWPILGDFFVALFDISCANPRKTIKNRRFRCKKKNYTCSRSWTRHDQAWLRDVPEIAGLPRFYRANYEMRSYLVGGRFLLPMALTGRCSASPMTSQRPDFQRRNHETNTLPKALLRTQQQAA